MPELVVMPQLGNTVESCLITRWLVGVGDEVTAGTVVCEVETDKSVMEVPAGTAGTVLALLAGAGDDVPVLQAILAIGERGEQVPAVAAPTASDASTAQAVAEAAVPDSAAGVSPRARRLAGSQGIDADRLIGSGPGGRVIERDVEAAIASGPQLTTGARAEAASFVPGPTGTGPAGTGIGGRVTRADLAAANSASPAPTTAPGPDFPGAFADEPLAGIRAVIAERMTNSLASSAQVSYTTTAPAARLLALRARLKQAADPELAAVTIGDLVGYAATRTVRRHPALNAHLSDGVVRRFEHVHLGLAVDTPRGLLVPTLRWADTLTLREFSVQSKLLARAAVDGSSSPDQLSGATFTVSNLGSYGIESFTPVLNWPQVAILGVGAIITRPVANADGSLAAEQRISFSLTADHQVVDGADAARYFADLSAAIADIDLLVLG